MALRISIHTLKHWSDGRGWLIENELPALRRSMRHFLVSSSKPGAVRGQHYHAKKREWFLVLLGEATIVFEDIKTKERKSVKVHAKDFQVVEMQPMVAHAIVNSGKGTLLLLGIVNESLNRRRPDTFSYKVV